MSTSPPGAPIGVTFASLMALGPALAVEVAADAARLGYRSFWTAEVNGPEAFSLLAAAGAAAPGLDLGTGVLALQLRTPMLAVMGASTLAELAPGREVLLGIGISSPVVTTRWHGAPYGERPLSQVREYLTLARACLSGEKVDFAGDHYEVRGFRLGIRPRGSTPRLVLGALNPKMLRLAGELADGVLLNYLPASHVAACVAEVRAGEAAAGRPAGSCTIYAYVHAGVGDREATGEPARRDLFSYAVVDSYARAFERAGFGAEVAAIREAHAAGDRASALAAVSDRMVDAIDVVGDADLVAATVAAYAAAGVDHPVLMPLPWAEDRRASLDATLRAAVGAG